MSAIMRRLRRNAMMYQLDYDRRIHMPTRGPRFYQRLCDAWLKWGRNYPRTPQGVTFAPEPAQKRFMERTWQRIRRFLAGTGSRV